MIPKELEYIMKEGRNIPLIVMLFAGSIVSIACIVYKFSLTQTLIFVLATLTALNGFAFKDLSDAQQRKFLNKSLYPFHCRNHTQVVIELPFPFHV